MRDVHGRVFVGVEEVVARFRVFSRSLRRWNMSGLYSLHHAFISTEAENTDIPRCEVTLDCRPLVRLLWLGEVRGEKGRLGLIHRPAKRYPRPTPR